MRQLNCTDTLVAAPEDGADGKMGSSIFFAGDWNSSMNYVLTEELRPYVKYGNKYYLRKGTSSDCINKNPLSDVQGENRYWSYTEKQSLILARKIAADEIDVTDLVVRNLKTSSGKVDIRDNGSLKAQDVEITGTFKAAIGDVYPGYGSWGDEDTPITSISEVLENNDYFVFYGNSLNSHCEDTIPLLEKYVGRKVYLMVDDQNDLTVKGRFYYGSAVRYSIFFSKQFVEMFCTKINGVIYWVVLQVHELNTSSRYGLPHKSLAYGKVNTSNLSNSTIKTFDGSKLTLTQMTKGDGGVYSTKISLPTSWFRSADEIYVQVTGIGSSTNNLGHSLFANVRSINRYYIEIILADDFSWNNGEFFFEIKNINQF